MSYQIILLGGPEHGKLVSADTHFPLIVIDQSKMPRPVTLAVPPYADDKDMNDAKVLYGERKIGFFDRVARIGVPMKFSESELSSLAFHTFINSFYQDFFRRR